MDSKIRKFLSVRAVTAVSLCIVTLYALTSVFAQPSYAMSLWSFRSISPAREITLLDRQPTVPLSLDRTAEGGYLVVLDTYPPAVVKLNGQGQTAWMFSEAAPGNGDIRFRMAQTDSAGNTVVCAVRRGGEKNRQELPSVVIKLNKDGREITRLDPLKRNLEGGAIYDIAACVPWGQGYAVVASESRPTGVLDDYGRTDALYRNVVIKLRSDLTLEWRKSIPLHANARAPSMAGPRALRNGDLVVPGMDRLFRIDSEGIVKARTELPACKWLRTQSNDWRLRLACVSLSSKVATTIIEYDESLNVVSRQELGHENVGVPSVAELSDGSYAIFGNNGPKGPFVQGYSAQGTELASYYFPHSRHEVGAVVDGLPDQGLSMVAARYIDKEDRFVTVLTWLKAR